MSTTGRSVFILSVRIFQNTLTMAAFSAKPHALLLIAPGCSNCPAVLAGLSELLKQGKLGRLEIVNVAAYPDAAAAVKARSVPWCRIGPFELAGAQSASALTQWTDHAAAGTGAGAYLSHLLETQRLAQAMALVNDDQSLLAHLVPLVGDLQTPMAVRIGVMALFEELAGDRRLDELIDQFGALTRAPEPQVRADAAHLLGLTGSPRAQPFLQPLLEDEDAEVREVATESLSLVNQAEA